MADGSDTIDRPVLELRGITKQFPGCLANDHIDLTIGRNEIHALLALSYLGGDAAQIDLGMPNAVTGIFQGVLLFFLLACDILILYRLRLRRTPALRLGAGD
jgi:hypothetical protein